MEANAADPRRRAGAAAGEGRASLRVVLLASQLALLYAVLRRFDLESPALQHVALLAFVGFGVHALLPMPLRLPLFTALSLAAVGLVMGLHNGLWLVGIGLALIGLCHLPVPFWLRVALLATAGSSLAVLRAGAVEAPWEASIWPILGSMFMFRLIVYLYDLRHEKAPAGPWRTLAYFFMLPNVCFPLFPVVDYRAFRRGYYDGDAVAIYQKGVRWMARGVLQLLLYRYIYYHLTLEPAQVSSPASLGQFMLSNYGLYLRVSGQFHLVVGMLQLFGFNLPETHRLYYLASSFNDFWRRINIYWKDFMMKIVYYPAWFRLKGLGPVAAMVGATLAVFTATWALHSYQWFWLRGSFPVVWQDLVFWGLLGVLVVANSLLEARRGRSRGRGFDAARGVRLALQTAGTFLFLCVLWSVWTSESLLEWTAIIRQALAGRSLAWLGALLGLVALFAGLHLAGQWLRGRLPAPFPSSRGAALATTVTLAALGLFSLPPVYRALGPRVTLVVESLSESRLSGGDRARLERGYYEGLLRVERFNSQLWELYAQRPEPPDPEHGEGVVRQRDDFLGVELIPDLRTTYQGVPFHTNRWGMRDGQYELRKPPHTYRIAVLGASHVLGLGVANDEPFEALLESRLNAVNRGLRFARFELLNFALGSYTPLHQVLLLEERVFPFDPDAVFLVAHTSDVRFVVDHLVNRLRAGVEAPLPYVRQALEELDIPRDAPRADIERRLHPEVLDMVGQAYGTFAKRCRERSIRPVWIHLPKTSENAAALRQIRNLRRLARRAGFEIIHLQGVYKGHAPRDLEVAAYDDHPNAFAHRLVAERLYEELLRRDADWELGLQAAPAPPRLPRPPGSP